MQLPTFFVPSHAEDFSYSCDPQAVMSEAVARRADAERHVHERFDVELLLIDQQRDFCFPQGSLFVGGRSGRGALDDNRRICEFIYRNAADIDMITPTLDTHSNVQIFSSSFWVDADDKPVVPHTQITLADIRGKRYRPSEAAYRLARGNRNWTDEYVEHYCRSLEENGRYSLLIWPPHCLAGSVGHALAGVVEEAVLYHSWYANASNQPFLKGGSPWTEEYSAISAEVERSHDGRSVAESRGNKLLRRLMGRKALIIAGEAASHCVKATLDDIMAHIERVDPSMKMTQQVYVLQDCMSSVVVPNSVDFTPQTEAALNRYRDAGMNIVNSTTPIAAWPGIRTR